MHAKTLGTLNLFIKKIAHQSFLFILGEKRTPSICFNFKIKYKRHQGICLKQIIYVLNKEYQLLLNEVYICLLFPMLA